MCCPFYQGRLKSPQNQPPQRHPCAVGWNPPVPPGWNRMDLCSGEGRTVNLRGQLLSLLSLQAWQLCVTSAPGVTTPRAHPGLHPSAPSLEFGLSQVPLPSSWQGGTSAAASLFPGQGILIPAPACEMWWHRITQHSKNPLPGSSVCYPPIPQGLVNAMIQSPWSWPGLTLVVRGLEFQKHFWCFLKS